MGIIRTVGAVCLKISWILVEIIIIIHMNIIIIAIVKIILMVRNRRIKWIGTDKEDITGRKRRVKLLIFLWIISSSKKKSGYKLDKGAEKKLEKFGQCFAYGATLDWTVLEGKSYEE